MATIVSDSFNRVDGSLGTADTGQTWVVESGTWAVVSSAAEAVTSVNGFAVIETGTQDSITKITVLNPTTAHSVGVICRWVSSSYFFSLTVDVFPGNIYRLRLKRIYAGVQATVYNQDISNPTNSSIAVGCCGSNFDIYIDDVLQGSYDDSAQPQNYGTLSGMRSFGDGGRADSFLVSTNGTCTPTYNCTLGVCVDPGDGTGTYATLAACLTGCSVAESYDCVSAECVDPGDGSGEFATLIACIQSGCQEDDNPVEVLQFDAGEGSDYYLVASVSDSGDELRSKTYKSVRHTGRRTNCSAMVYGYDVDQEISVDDLETGTRSNSRMTTNPQSFDDSTGISQSKRKPVNITNAVLGTVRIEGSDIGNEERDRIDEIVIEQSIQGVRR